MVTPPAALTRVAVVQAAPVAFDTGATLDRLDDLLAGAAAAGARLVVLPEAFVGGYPKGSDFGARVGTRSDAGREWFRRYHAGAIDVPGPAVARIGAAARAHGLFVVCGVVERDGGTLYCTALFIGDDGALLARHRKLVPTGVERLIWGRGDGSTLPVVDTPAGALAAAICWENYVPLYRAALYERGVTVWCAPTVDDRDVWIATMRHIAVEGRCFVLSACQFATRADYPADYACPQGDDPATVLIRGGSCVVDPFGDVLAGPLYGRADLLVADLDLDQVVRGRFDLDVRGHSARPDLFRLHVGPSHGPAS
ncbi:MAG: carbon-nitrogen hydrolase family protein [Planctomycetes bacterium]|nr:carbon-nitrogen hydrolase family protein [Planctomycetota bacterium]